MSTRKSSVNDEDNGSFSVFTRVQYDMPRGVGKPRQQIFIGKAEKEFAPVYALCHFMLNPNIAMQKKIEQAKKKAGTANKNKPTVTLADITYEDLVMYFEWLSTTKTAAKNLNMASHIVDRSQQVEFARQMIDKIAAAAETSKQKQFKKVPAQGTSSTPTTLSASSSPYPAAIVYGFTASTTTSTPQKQDLVVPKDLLNLVVRGDEHLLDDLFPPDLFPPDLVPKTQPQASTNFSDELKPEDYMNLNLSDYEDDDDEEVDEFTEAMFPGPQDNLLEPDNSQMEIVRHGVKQARKKPIITQQNNQGGSGTGPGNKKSKRG